MKGTPDNTVILHWDECQTLWTELPWQDWVRFRGLGEGGLSLLAGAEAGEHYFLVCVLGDRGELDNVIPHRYVLSTDGRLVHSFDGLGEAEREVLPIQVLRLPTIEDSERYRGSARADLPSICLLHTVQPLLSAMPGLAERGPPPHAGISSRRSAFAARARGAISLCPCHHLPSCYWSPPRRARRGFQEPIMREALMRQEVAVAQSVEHVTFNHGVVGSDPAGLTNP